MKSSTSTTFLRTLQKLGEQFAKNNGLAASVSGKSAKPSKPWASRCPAVQAKKWRMNNLEKLQFD